MSEENGPITLKYSKNRFGERMTVTIRPDYDEGSFWWIFHYGDYFVDGKLVRRRKRKQLGESDFLFADAKRRADDQKRFNLGFLEARSTDLVLNAENL